MRVFVLGTGRCGTMTFAKACSHITNYTSGHETHRRHPERFPVYPDNHIEVDAHLSWMLGSLGDNQHTTYDVKYVYLYRRPDATAESFLNRPGAQQLVAALFQTREPQKLPLMRLLVEHIQCNIEVFLRGRQSMFIDIDSAAQQWPEFWRWIGAEGDMEAGRKEFEVRYNASSPTSVSVPAGMNRMTLNVTWDCNRSCPLCSQQKLREWYPDYQMSMDEIKAFIQSTGSHRFDSITISGGEPLLWENLKEGLACLRAANIADKIAVFSNGMLRDQITPEVMGYLDLLRLSWYEGNEATMIELKGNWGDRVQVVDRRSHTPSPGSLLPHDEVMPAECSCTGWMVCGEWAFSCSMLPSVIAECQISIQGYPELMCKVEPGYLERLAPYVPACYDPCRGCVSNHKVVRAMGVKCR